MNNKPRRKKVGKNRYWTSIQEFAISAYIRTPDSQHVKRSKIYKRFLANAFYEMARQIIGKGGFKYQLGTWEDQEELLSQTIAHMVIQIPQVDFSRGKAFSFYSRIVYNFLIYRCKKEYKRGTMFVSSEDGDYDADNSFDISSSLYQYHTEDLQKLSHHYLDKIEYLFNVSASVLNSSESGVLVQVRDIIENIDFGYGFIFQRDVVSYIHSKVSSSSIQDVRFMIEKIAKCQINA